MPNNFTSADQFEVPGFPGRKFEFMPEVKAIPEVRAFILRNIEPDVFEKLLIADGRFSDQFLTRYRRNLRKQGRKVQQGKLKGK